MPTHKNYLWTAIEEASEHMLEVQKLATAFGIHDVTQDNGWKVLQVAAAIGVTIVPGRNGADYKDIFGNEFEAKSLNLNGSSKGFSTNHHLKKSTIDKFRERTFIFATYDDLLLQEVYAVESVDMEPLYKKWLEQLKTKTHLNNPKIPLDYVREVGEIMYLKDIAPIWARGK